MKFSLLFWLVASELVQLRTAGLSEPATTAVGQLQASKQLLEDYRTTKNPESLVAAADYARESAMASDRPQEQLEFVVELGEYCLELSDKILIGKMHPHKPDGSRSRCLQSAGSALAEMRDENGELLEHARQHLRRFSSQIDWGPRGPPQKRLDSIKKRISKARTPEEFFRAGRELDELFPRHARSEQTADVWMYFREKGIEKAFVPNDYDPFVSALPPQ